MTMERNEHIAMGMIGVFFLFIGAFVLLPHSSLTGFVTREGALPPSNPGFYSIAPNFKASFDYDLNIYDRIGKDLHIISSCASTGTPLESCIKQRTNTQELTWESNCDRGSERVFYDIAQFYEECLASDDTGCFCERSLQYLPEDIKKWGLEGSYELSFSQRNDLKAITMRISGKELEYNITTSSTFSREPLALRFSYGGESLKDSSMEFSSSLSGSTYYLNSFDSLLLYKFDNRYSDRKQNEAQFLDKIKWKLASQTDTIAIPRSKRACIIKPRNIQRFCVSDPKKKYLIYDGNDGQLKERAITIKFAAHIPDTPPPVLENVATIDSPKAEKSTILSWKESPAGDVTYYRIYRAQSAQQLALPTNQLSKNQEIVITTLDIASIQTLPATPLASSCTFDYSQRKCLFIAGTKSVPIEKNVLYSAPSDDGSSKNFITSLSLPSDGEYAFAITAVDKNGNEIDNSASQKLPIVSVISTDDLPPSSEGVVGLIARLFSAYDWNEKTLTYPSLNIPSRNIDNTPTADFDENNGYMAYYQKNPSTAPTENTALKDFKTITPSQSGTSLKIPIPENPQPGDSYYLVIIAQDRLGNPKQAQFTPKEIGASVQVLTIEQEPSLAIIAP